MRSLQGSGSSGAQHRRRRTDKSDQLPNVGAHTIIELVHKWGFGSSTRPRREHHSAAAARQARRAAEAQQKARAASDHEHQHTDTDTDTGTGTGTAAVEGQTVSASGEGTGLGGHAERPASAAVLSGDVDLPLQSRTGLRERTGGPDTALVNTKPVNPFAVASSVTSRSPATVTSTGASGAGGAPAVSGNPFARVSPAQQPDTYPSEEHEQRFSPGTGPATSPNDNVPVVAADEHGDDKQRSSDAAIAKTGRFEHSGPPVTPLATRPTSDSTMAVDGEDTESDEEEDEDQDYGAYR